MLNPNTPSTTVPVNHIYVSLFLLKNTLKTDTILHLENGLSWTYSSIYLHSMN